MLNGNGITIILDDTTQDLIDEPISYRDILVLVNELKSAGAEAISVNGKRVINTTEIRYISSTKIVINGEYITSPYTIKAIGNIDNLTSSMKFKGGIVEELETRGIVTTIESSKELIIDKYDGVIQYKYAEVVEDEQSN